MKGLEPVENIYKEISQVLVEWEGLHSHVLLLHDLPLNSLGCPGALWETKGSCRFHRRRGFKHLQLSVKMEFNDSNVFLPVVGILNMDA